VIAGTCSSDARLKKDVEPFPAVLERVVQLRPVHFFWRAEEYPELKLGTERSYGLVAQEVEAVFPELVTEDERGFKAVRYGQLPFLLLQALRELKAENDSLREAQAAELIRLRAELEDAKQLFRQLANEVSAARASSGNQ